MNFKHYRGDSYDFSWTYLLADEFKRYSSNNYDSCLHYGISLLKKASMIKENIMLMLKTMLTLV